MSSWKRIRPKECDLCNKRAIWEHPLGGFRCQNCARPSCPCKRCSKRKENLDEKLARENREYWETQSSRALHRLEAADNNRCLLPGEDDDRY